MPEVLFYHLQGGVSVDAVLPRLLERCLERGWRVVIEAGSEERVGALDAHLWTYREDSFLPHGTGREREHAEQPILIVVGQENPNGANVRFLLEGAGLADDASSYERLVVLFDGEDEDALAAARREWQEAKRRGFDATYWQQDQRGRWERKA